MRRLAHLTLPLLVFVVGLAVGAWFSPGRRAGAWPADVEHGRANTVEAGSAPGSEAGRNFPSDEEMLTALMSAVAEQEPFLRSHRLHDLLGRLNSAELAVLFGRTLQIDDYERRHLVLFSLLARWAEVDPTAAAAAARPYRDRVRKMGRVDGWSLDAWVDMAWTCAQPEAALAEALAAPEAAWARKTASTALSTLADGSSPAQQLDLLARLPASRLRGDLCAKAIKALADQDSAAAEAKLDLVPDPRQQASLQAEILGKLTDRDPSAGLARLAALAPDLVAGATGTQLVSRVLEAAARKDAPAALAALDGLPEELHTAALNSVLTGWMSNHPTEALEWALANGVSVADARAVSFDDQGNAGWNSLIGVAFGRDRAKTLEWLRAQPASAERDAMLMEAIRISGMVGQNATATEQIAIYNELAPEVRTDMAPAIVQALSYEGLDRAEAWVKEQPPGEARAAAVQALTEWQLSQYPERIDTLADAWPAGPDRDAALSFIGENFSGTDPQRAMSFFQRIGDPATRENGFKDTVRRWLARDATAARAWLASTTEISADAKRRMLSWFGDK